jgi:hypothetical protein
MDLGAGAIRGVRIPAGASLRVDQLPNFQRPAASCNKTVRYILLIVVISALLFAAYHYWSPTEQFDSRIFAFRTVAGIYFGAIFYVPWIWHNRWKPLRL